MTIRDLLEKQAAARPGGTAVKYHDDGRWVERTWSDLLRAVQETAEGYGTRFALKSCEENTAIILPNSALWV